MLTRILDTSGIDMSNSEIRGELELDLIRMDKLQHYDMPENVDTYRLKVTPSIRTYMRGLHRFRFEIQYGNMKDNKFEPKGELVLSQSELLPMM